MIILNETMLSMRERISSNLALRHSADALFDYINSINESRIIINFSGIESITRSFAHQYTTNKNKTNKQIIECDIPPRIKQMFELVEGQKREAVMKID